MVPLIVHRVTAFGALEALSYLGVDLFSLPRGSAKVIALG